MSEKKSSIIKTVREGKKISILQRLNPLNWPGIFIGKFLKTQDSIKAFNEKVVRDKASGTQLSWYVDLYSMFNPLLEFKAFRLRRKNQRDSFKKEIKQSIITKNDKPLTFRRQFLFELGRKWVPFFKSADAEAHKEMRGHNVPRRPGGKGGNDSR